MRLAEAISASRTTYYACGFCTFPLAAAINIKFLNRELLASATRWRKGLYLFPSLCVFLLFLYFSFPKIWNSFFFVVSSRRRWRGRREISFRLFPIYIPLSRPSSALASCSANNTHGVAKKIQKSLSTAPFSGSFPLLPTFLFRFPSSSLSFP